MSNEVLLLVLSTTLFGSYIAVQSLLYRADVGMMYAATARDDDREPGLYAKRADRALRNLLETYAVFVALSVATELSGHADWLTFWGGWTWFVARWAYLPLYVFGVFMVRSLVWCVSAIGLAMMFFGVLF